ncbi:hypothetical protein ACFLZ2_01900 [Candidatus Margulisiibacteriota bacterium]
MNIKGMITVIIFTILMASSCFAADNINSSEYIYADSVIRALILSDRALSMQENMIDQLGSYRESIADQNKLLERAKTLMKPYLECGDLKRELGADIIIKAADNRISINTVKLKVAEKYGLYVTEDDLSDHEYSDMISMLNSVPQNSWKGVISIAQYAVIDMAEKPYSGSIKFSVSSSERNGIIKEVNKYFGEKIKEALKNEHNDYYDKEEEQQNILQAAYKMRTFLESSTYAEFHSKKNLLWPEDEEKMSTPSPRPQMK